jgi:hypothetical protein
MQMQIFRRVGLGFMALGLTLSALAILSCGGSDDGDTTERNAALSGAGERNAAGAVPAAAASTPGSGTAVLTVSGDQTQIEYVLTYTALTGVQQAHIHVGGPNDNGPIILFLCTNVGVGAVSVPTPPPCPTGSGSVSGTLTAANLIPRPATPVVTGVTPAINNFADAVTQVLNGNTYTNVHTAVNPGGEIRGQDL